MWCGICQQRWIIPNSSTPLISVAVLLSACALLSFGALMFHCARWRGWSVCVCVLCCWESVHWCRPCVCLRMQTRSSCCVPPVVPSGLLWLQTVPLGWQELGALVGRQRPAAWKNRRAFQTVIDTGHIDWLYYSLLLLFIAPCRFGPGAPLRSRGSRPQQQHL